MRCKIMSIMLLVLVFVSVNHSQDSKDLVSFLQKHVIFTKVNGNFYPNKYVIKSKDTLFYIANFIPKSNKEERIDLKYYLPSREGKKISKKGFFRYNGKKMFVNIKEENNEKWDELDESSLELFRTAFKGKNYLLITGTASGPRTAVDVFCLLMNITDSKNPKTNFLHTTLGGYFCFGDFNEDGILDFLDLNKIGDDYDKLRVTLKSMLDGHDFVDFHPDKYFMIVKPNGLGRFDIISKHWF